MHRTNFLIGYQDSWLVVDRFHAGCVSDHQGAHKAAIHSKAFNHFTLKAQSLTFFHGNNTVFTYPGNDIGNKFTNLGVAGTNGSYFGNTICLTGYIFTESTELFNDIAGSSFKPFAQQHRVVSSGDELMRFTEDVVGQNRHSGCAITSYIIHLAGCLLDELCTNFVTECFVVYIGNVNTLGNGYAVMGNGDATVALTYNNISPFRTHGGLYGVV